MLQIKFQAIFRSTELKAIKRKRMGRKMEKKSAFLATNIQTNNNPF